MAPSTDESFIDFFRSAPINNNTIKTADGATKNLLAIASFLEELTSDPESTPDKKSITLDFPAFPRDNERRKNFLTYDHLLQRLRLDYEGLSTFARGLTTNETAVGFQTSLKELGRSLENLGEPSTKGSREVPHCSVMELLVELCFKSVSPTPTTIDDFERLVLSPLKSRLAHPAGREMTNAAVPIVIFVFTNEDGLMVTASTADWRFFGDLHGALRAARVNHFKCKVPTCTDCLTPEYLTHVRHQLIIEWKNGENSWKEFRKNGSLEVGWVEKVRAKVQAMVKSNKSFMQLDHSSVQGKSFRVYPEQPASQEQQASQDQHTSLFEPTPRCVKCRVLYKFNMGMETDPTNYENVYKVGTCGEDVAHLILEVSKHEKGKGLVFTTDQATSIY